MTQRVRTNSEMQAGASAPEAALGNIEYVRLLWQAFKSGGVAALAKLVPPEVRWRPMAAGGHALQGTQDLDRFWSGRDPVMPSLRMFYGRGDDVLVEAEYRDDDECVRTIWLLYCFRGTTLVEAVAFRDEAHARSYEPPSALA